MDSAQTKSEGNWLKQEKKILNDFMSWIVLVLYQMGDRLKRKAEPFCQNKESFQHKIENLLNQWKQIWSFTATLYCMS